VRFLDKTKFEVEVLSFTEGPMVDKLKALGIKTHIIPTLKPFDTKCWRAVKDLIKAGDFDLVHAHGTRAASNVFFGAKQTKKPLIYTVHGWSFHDGQNPVVRKLREISEGFLTRKANLTIAVSKSNEKDGQQRFGLSKSAVVFNGIDFEKFKINSEERNKIRVELNLPTNKTIVGYMVRMTYQKDPFTFIKAIAKVTFKSSAVHFLIVGNGELEEETKALAAAYGLEHCITFLDFRSDIPALLNAIDIYCLPSLWEGMPIGLLEAMAMGKACIATGVDGTLELIQHEENGILIPKKDEQALANAILDLHLNPSKRKQLSMNAQALIQAEYSLDRMVKQVEKTYTSLLNKEDHSFQLKTNSLSYSH